MSEAPPARSSELRLRVLSALVLGFVGLAATWWGGPVFRLLWVAVAGLVAYEWLAIVSRRHAVPGGIGVVAAALALWLLPIGHVALAGVSAFAALVAAALVPRLTGHAALAACGVLYALVFALVTPTLRETPQIGLLVIVWTFAVVWLTDIAAYFSGRRFGGPKLMPSVSPKKTWSGALGGTLAGTLGGMLVWWLAPAQPTSLWAIALVSFLSSVASQIGDLYESGLKRRFGVKDSSRLIPGHGGFLDRLDGYWAVLVFSGLLLLALHLPN